MNACVFLKSNYNYKLLKMKALAFLLTITIVSLIKAESTSEADLVTICPKVTCSEPLGDKVCYMHSGTNPVEWVKLQQCPNGYLCDYTQNMAWYDTLQQSILGSSNPLKSPTWRKQTIAKCEPLNSFRQNLLPGRDCSVNYEC